MKTPGSTWIPLPLKRCGRSLVDTASRQPASALLRALGLALYWQQQLDDGTYPSLAALAQCEGRDISTVSRIVQLARLAPDLIETCLAGEQPRTLNLKWLQRHRLPNDWVAQQQFFESFP
jgi:hypothetical protein